MVDNDKSGNEESRPSAAGAEFASRWLKRLDLPSAWKEPARRHLEQLCFSVPQHTWPLIESLFTIVPEILNREPKRKALAEAYAWCCYALFSLRLAPRFLYQATSALTQSVI